MPDMSQVKIYGLADSLFHRRDDLSDVIHACLVEVLGLPTEKRFQRFIPLADLDFIYPGDRTRDYTILEISMFEGRSAETKKALINALFAAFAKSPLNIAPQDLEITIIETPRANWGIRGQPGDELELSYTVQT